MSREFRSRLLGVAVVLALADSSVVTLALPDIVSQFGVSITDVAWVLVSYNLVLAAAAVPAAHLVRVRPRIYCALGLLVFAAASLVCGLASAFAVLVAGRCVQALGAALIVATAHILLESLAGSERDGARVWARAGVLGAALGPAIGGVLTQIAGWEAIFLAQAPVALLPLLALWRLQVRRASSPVTVGRPRLGPNLALLLGSAALSAALFLLVILLVNGWSIDPAAAGLIVTLIPLAAIVSERVATARLANRSVRAATGFILMAGGLAALGLLPHAGWGWTIAPQLLVGAGLGLTVTTLTEQALTRRSPQVVHGGWTIASRHAGIVIGLLVLTPVFTHALARNQEEATRAGAAIVLDSSIEPLRKVDVAQEVLRTIDEADGRLPDLLPVLYGDAGDDAEELRRVGKELQQQLERAVTSAFGPPFLMAAFFALGRLCAVALTRRRRAVIRSAAVSSRPQPCRAPSFSPTPPSAAAVTPRPPPSSVRTAPGAHPTGLRRRSSRSRSRPQTAQRAISVSPARSSCSRSASEADLDHFADEHDISRERRRERDPRRACPRGRRRRGSRGDLGATARLLRGIATRAPDRARPHRPSRSLRPSTFLRERVACGSSARSHGRHSSSQAAAPARPPAKLCHHGVARLPDR